MPSRNVSVTDSCRIRQGPLPAGRPRTTCSDACRQALWRRRHQPNLTAPAPPAHAPGKASTVYECDTCTKRALGEQYCEDCHTFMRRLGYGGISPCWAEPVTCDELLNA